MHDDRMFGRKISSAEAIKLSANTYLRQGGSPSNDLSDTPNFVISSAVKSSAAETPVGPGSICVHPSMYA